MIYDENRRIQSEDHLKKFFTFKHGQNQDFQEYMEAITGFFIIEAVVMESTEDFRSRHQVEQLWEISTAKLLKIISESLYECTDPDIILDIKQTVVSFIHTMEVRFREINQKEIWIFGGEFDGFNGFIIRYLG